MTAAAAQSNQHVRSSASSPRTSDHSSEGTLTVTAIVASSVRVIIRPDGQQEILVANAPDRRESVAAQENAVLVASQAVKAVRVSAHALLPTSASSVRSGYSATELQTTLQAVYRSVDGSSQAGALPERSWRNVPQLPSEGKPDAGPLRK